MFLCKITNMIKQIPGHALREKGLQRQKSVESTGQQPGTKSASRPADKPVTHRLSTGGFVPAFGLHRVSLVRASGRTFRRRVLDSLEGARNACLLGELFCRRQSCPTPPRRPAVRSDPTRGMLGFWIRQVSINMSYIHKHFFLQNAQKESLLLCTARYTFRSYLYEG